MFLLSIFHPQPRQTDHASFFIDFQFSKNSIAKIYSASLMGGKSLAVIPSYDGALAVPGDYLAGEIESDMFSSVGEKLNPFVQL